MSGKSISKATLVFFIAFTLLIMTCSAPSAEDKRNDLPNTYYSGIFDVKVDLDITKLGYGAINAAELHYGSCQNMVMRVAIGVNISNSEVIGQTFHLADESSKKNHCSELFDGDFSGELASDGSFSSILFSMRSRSGKSYRTKLTGSISEGSKFKLVDWYLESDKFQWVKGASPELSAARAALNKTKTETEAERLAREQAEAERLKLAVAEALEKRTLELTETEADRLTREQAEAERLKLAVAEALEKRTLELAEKERAFEGQLKALQEAQNRLEELALIDRQSDVAQNQGQTAAQEPFIDARDRVALIIGNSFYNSLPKLQNPSNDAQSMRRALIESNFDTTVYENLDLKGMQDALRTFGNRLNKDTVGLFYFAGHGMEFEGENYLVPVNENIVKPYELATAAISMKLVTNTLKYADNEMSLVIVDACRNSGLGDSRGVGDGFAVTRAAEGMYIAFSTAPGMAALDGEGNNSPYTKYLSQAITESNGESLETLFKKVRADVMRETEGRQIPWENSSLLGEFRFK